MKKIGEKEAGELKAKVGGRRLRMLSVMNGDYVIRCPTGAEIARMNMAFTDAEKRVSAARRLILDTLVWPSQEEAAKDFEEFPALPLSLLDDVLDMAGMTGDVEKKDL